MKPAPFVYHDPRTVAEAADLLGRLENARPLAGGQSLMPMMNFRFAMPDHLIDLNRVGGLAGIDVVGDTLRIGAMTRQRDLEFSSVIAQRCPILQDALRHIGHRQTRNRGTLGGSLCHLDPAAELVNVTALHDGILVAESRRGARDLAFTDFAAGFMTHGLAPDELLTAVVVSPWSSTHGHAFVEMARRQGDFAIAAVGALIELDERGAIRRAAVAVSGLGPAPLRPAAIERLLVGGRPGHELYRAAAAEAATLEAMSDAYVTGAYRQHLARILTYRALEGAVGRAMQRRAA
jgi:carbon-monoxide dehydrogenase medium subunit